ncbi:MAG: hypothetical protein KAI22_09895 [Gammaproteobacteria bacterium]|nr:hypothetical protein [Gammaproteobacteria bacterium]
MKKILLISAVCLYISVGFLYQAQAIELPVFLVKTEGFDKEKAHGLFMNAFSSNKPKFVKNRFRPSAVIMQRGTQKLEFDKRSGHWYAADKSKLWTSKVKGKVPGRANANKIAAQFIDNAKLLPSSKFVKFKQIALTETAIGNDRRRLKNKRVLDYTTTWRAFVSAERKNIPVIGGGSEISATVGAEGKITSFMGGWRPIVKKVDTIETGIAKEAIKKFLKTAGTAKYKNLKASLAYYAEPAFKKQQYLAPVWIVSGNIVNGKEVIPFRPQIISASKYGPIWKKGLKSKSRSIRQYIPKPTKGDEEMHVKLNILDSLISPAYAANSLECGASWIGESQGLGGSSGNRQGFIDKCRDSGWNVNFDWGNAAAFESDWRRNDDSYIDAVDLVFYTGHASPNGWNLFNPDDTSLNFSEVSGGSDMWGQQDLEWLIVAACGPLQSSHFVGSTNNAFDRWRNAFDGLHSMLAYGAVTYDNTDEGRRFMELALSGDDVIDAWFRTAREIQPATNNYDAPNGPNIYVVAMYAHNGDYCTENDHIHGSGSVCPDVRGSGQRRTMMWSGT